MKKIAVFGLMFFIFFSQVFANENSDKFENIIFTWQLFYYPENYQEIDFIDLNPIFFNNNKNCMLSYYAYFNQNNNSQNISFQRNRNTQSNNQENNLGFLILRAIAECLAASYNIGQYNNRITTTTIR